MIEPSGSNHFPKVQQSKTTFLNIPLWRTFHIQTTASGKKTDRVCWLGDFCKRQAGNTKVGKGRLSRRLWTAQAAECLFFLHSQGPGFRPRHFLNSVWWSLHMWQPSSWELMAGGTKIQGHFFGHKKFEASLRFVRYFFIRRNKIWENQNQNKRKAGVRSAGTYLKKPSPP